MAAMQQQDFTCPNQELVDLLRGLYHCQELKGLKFALVVSKNIKILTTILADIEEVSKPDPEFMKVAQQVSAIDGKTEEGAKEIKKLEKANAKLIDAREKQMAEIKKLMAEEGKASLWMVTEDILPDDITALQLNSIYKIIK